MTTWELFLELGILLCRGNFTNIQETNTNNTQTVDLTALESGEVIVYPLQSYMMCIPIK